MATTACAARGSRIDGAACQPERIARAGVGRQLSVSVAVQRAPFHAAKRPVAAWTRSRGGASSSVSVSRPSATVTRAPCTVPSRRAARVAAADHDARGAEALLDADRRVARTAPAAGDARGHRPQVQPADLLAADRLVRRVDGDRAVGRPVAHLPVVRHDARARLQREQARPQLQVHLGEQVQRDHARPRKVGREQVLRAELDAARRRRRARALSRLFATRSGTYSTPRPRAPKRCAATMTMRPSPEPRSIR